MWLAIFGTVIICMVLSLFFLLSRFRKFSIIKNLAKEKRIISRLFPVLILLVVLVLLTLTLGLINCIICVLHLVAVWGIADITAFIVSKIRKKSFEKYYSGGIAIAFTAVYLCFGWYCAHHVWRTEYNLKTDKNIGSLHIVQFADAHMGTTFGTEKFYEHLAHMKDENPDVVLITGDFVDDGTSREEMIEACRALGDGGVNSKYGVFFSFGNHDSGYYSEKQRGWSRKEFKDALEENGVTVLEDESVLIDDRFYIIGRCDVSVENEQLLKGDGRRKSMDELTGNIDKSKYMIVMDHQPHDYIAEADSGVDLVLSGHTHGGQLIPITYVGEWIGVNFRTYGHEKRNNTDFIVTSGISDWAMDFKTGCKSEYVVINVTE